MKLIQYYDNYADEFDVNGSVVFDDEDWELWLQAIEYISLPYEFYFGTNEGIQYWTKEEFLDTLNVIDITEEEFKVLEKFGYVNNGTVPHILQDFVTDYLVEDFKERNPELAKKLSEEG